MGRINDVQMGSEPQVEDINEDNSSLEAQQNIESQQSAGGDPAGVQVTISDQTTPIVVLFGPPAVGKTMTLIRLSRYLQSKGYKVSPIYDFRPQSDTQYKQNCNNFSQKIDTKQAAPSTYLMDFMLVKVSKNGDTICQILEAPGEGYFDLSNPTKKMARYVNTIMNCKNRKIMLIFVEPTKTSSLETIDIRKKYVERINELKQKMSPCDRSLIVFNKINETDFEISKASVNIRATIKEVKDKYPGIFENFKNENPITKLWRPYNCEFIPFETGEYTRDINGDMQYDESPDEYPQRLWNMILKLRRG